MVSGLRAKPVPIRARRRGAGPRIDAGEGIMGEARASEPGRARRRKIWMTDSFAHHLRLDQIREGERVDLSADEGERAAICARLGLDAVDRLDAHATLTPSGSAIRAQGRLAAALTQSCVI